MGCEIAKRQPLPPSTIQMIGAVREQADSRARDLDALVKLKNSPVPDNLGVQNSKQINALERTDSAAWDSTIIAFFRTTHTSAMRLMRDLADRAKDPDVRAFAARQLHGIVATLHQLERSAESTP